MGVRSEYQKHFKVSALRKSLPNYYENVAFRTARRDREYAHTPLSWYEEETRSVASEDSSDDETEQEKRTCNEQSSPVASVKSDVDASQPVVNNNGNKPVLIETVTIEKSSVNKEQDIRKDVSQTASSPLCQESNSATVIQEKCSDSHSPEVKIKSKRAARKVLDTKQQFRKLERPDRKQKIPRPWSSGKQSHAKTTVVHHPAPFVSYGWADVERDLCLHKTFNVKATTDVHPAAKRALARQKEASRERHSATAKRTSEDRLKAMLQAAALEKQRQELEWKSEYQQKFAAYDVTEYSRSLSARANERKLDRIVYVP